MKTFTASPARKTRTCKRCAGTGKVKSHVSHLGLPGCCFGCDGRGLQQFFTKEELDEGKAQIEKEWKEGLVKKASVLKESELAGRLHSEDVKDELERCRDQWRACGKWTPSVRGEWKA